MSELYIRLGMFFGSVILFGILEAYLPRRPIPFLRRSRWSKNYAFVFISSALMRFTLPLSATGAAILANNTQIGLFNWVNLGLVWPILLSILLLDLLIYLQHLLFHATPILWRIHQVHHIDEAIDSSTALRFHPAEYLLSALIKISAIFLLGIPWLAVLIFEVILNSMAIFNHANIKLPTKLDGVLRYLIVTPDMHRIHHSVYEKEYHSNFGFNLSIWDKLFKTYTDTPKDTHETMAIGQTSFKDPTNNTLLSMLLHPFRRK